MKKVLIALAALTTQLLPLAGNEKNGFILKENLAQYKGSDYSNAVHVERGITVEQAIEIAESRADVDYFVYVKGYMMVLEVPPGVACDPAQDPLHLLSHTNFIYDAGHMGMGYCRVFRHGDVVFFKNEGMWLGSAPGLADTYFKEASILQ
jgi:hypothetical protein